MPPGPAGREVQPDLAPGLEELAARAPRPKGTGRAGSRGLFRAGGSRRCVASVRPSDDELPPKLGELLPEERRVDRRRRRRAARRPAGRGVDGDRRAAAARRRASGPSPGRGPLHPTDGAKRPAGTSPFLQPAAAGPRRPRCRRNTLRTSGGGLRGARRTPGSRRGRLRRGRFASATASSETIERPGCRMTGSASRGVKPDAVALRAPPRAHRARGPDLLLRLHAGGALRPRRGLLRARRGDRRARRLRDLAARLAGLRGRARARLRAGRREAGRGAGRLRRGRRRDGPVPRGFHRDAARARPRPPRPAPADGHRVVGARPGGDRGPGPRARAAHPRRRRGPPGGLRRRAGSSRTSSTTRSRSRGSMGSEEGLQELRVGVEDGRFVWTAVAGARSRCGGTSRSSASRSSRARRARSSPGLGPLASAPRARALARVARRVRLRPPGAHPLSPLRAARGHARRAHRRAPRRRPARRPGSPRPHGARELGRAARSGRGRGTAHRPASRGRACT